MLLHEFLERSADRLGEKVCLVSGSERLTYTEVEQRANRLAQALRAQGIARGDRVALFMPNSVELVVSIFGVLKAGGVFMVVNHTTKGDKLQYLLELGECAGLITDQRGYVPNQEVIAQVASLKTLIVSGGEPDAENVISWDAVQGQYSDERPAHVNIDLDLACLISTSGSTGDAKCIMCDHSNMVFAADSIISYIGNVEDDVILCAVPMSFDYGLYQLLMTFRFGGRLVLEKGFTFPAAVLKKMETEQVTGFPGVPTTFAMLLQIDLSHYDLSNLRYLTNTAAALPVEHIEQLRDKFNWATLYSMYGLSETKRTLYLPPEQLNERPGSVGVPIPGTEAWIEDEAGQRLGPGEVGELVVRGRHVMRGYWRDAEASAERFRPGPIPGERLCYTGDLFKMDEAGYFYFVSRKDDIIKSRGEKVAPKELEGILYRMAGVQEVAVIGVPDPILGQAVKAFVVVDLEEITAAEVLRYCRANMEDYFVPRQIEIRDTLPKSAHGKIDKRALQAEQTELV